MSLRINTNFTCLPLDYIQVNQAKSSRMSTMQCDTVPVTNAGFRGITLVVRWQVIYLAEYHTKRDTDVVTIYVSPNISAVSCWTCAWSWLVLEHRNEALGLVTLVLVHNTAQYRNIFLNGSSGKLRRWGWRGGDVDLSTRWVSLEMKE